MRAQQDGPSLQVIEWPGGEPSQARLAVNSDVVADVRHGRRSVPLDGATNLGEYAGLAWGSVVTLEAPGDSLHVAVGPARYVRNSKGGQWVLPLLPDSNPGEAEELVLYADQFRKDHGLFVRD